jgi:hypothetical protein
MIADTDPRITFVVAAGNAGQVTDDGTGTQKRCHSRFTLDVAGQPGSQRDLCWDIDRPDDTESFMELWASKVDAGAAHGLRISLEHELDPTMRSGEVAPGSAKCIVEERGGAVSEPESDSVVAMVINATGVTTAPNSEGRPMALIALGHSRNVGRASVPTGRWKVSVTNQGTSSVNVDARIERRDVPGELPGYRPQYGFASNGAQSVDKDSLGTLANGKRSIVVGALDLNQAANQLEIAGYSSRGPGGETGREPDFYALGLRTSNGFFSGTKKSLAGTSVAAALVTAAIASALAGDAAKRGASVRNALSRLAKQRWAILPMNQKKGGGPAVPSPKLKRPLSRRVVILPLGGPSGGAQHVATAATLCSGVDLSAATKIRCDSMQRTVGAIG